MALLTPPTLNTSTITFIVGEAECRGAMRQYQIFEPHRESPSYPKPNYLPINQNRNESKPMLFWGVLKASLTSYPGSEIPPVNVWCSVVACAGRCDRVSGVPHQAARSVMFSARPVNKLTRRSRNANPGAAQLANIRIRGTQTLRALRPVQIFHFSTVSFPLRLASDQ